MLRRRSIAACAACRQLGFSALPPSCGMIRPESPGRRAAAFVTERSSRCHLGLADEVVRESERSAEICRQTAVPFCGR